MGAAMVEMIYKVSRVSIITSDQNFDFDTQSVLRSSHLEELSKSSSSLDRCAAHH